MTRPVPSQIVQSVEAEQPTRYHQGWRRGKPEEDPEKTKPWGWISAKPSEFLIRMRGGRVISQGQGATIFKWPWDSVAIVPTSIQRLHFVADQITQEKVGVKVTGIAVYRIAEPLIAFRMLNFSFPERAQEKLAQMMEEMCVGASRRLIANLTVEQCLTRRKEALSTELVQEIAPVVSGTGRVNDATDRGWGLVVDTIEIQDVKVMSAQVFANMQARFRQDQERLAREAELAKERAIRTDETSTQRQLQLAQVEASDEIRRRTQSSEEAARLEQLQSEATVQHERLRSEMDATRLRAEQTQLEHQARLAEEQQAIELLQTQALAAEAKRALTEIEARTVELEVLKQQHLATMELDRAQRQRDIDNTLSPEVIQLAVANKLPELAQAFHQKMGEVHVTAVDGANPFGYVAAAVEGVMGLARSAGLALPKPAEPRPENSK